MIQKWEYDVVTYRSISEFSQLNGSGDDGWELVSTIISKNGTEYICIFKRPML